MRSGKEDRRDTPPTGTSAERDPDSMIGQMRRFNESRKVCKGRLCSMRGTLKKLERSQEYKREIEGIKDFTLCLDSLTATSV